MEDTYVKFVDGDDTVYKAKFDEDSGVYLVNGIVYQPDEVNECYEDGTLFDDFSDDTTFCLTPFSCFGISLGDANIVDDGFDELMSDRLRKAFAIFERKMIDNGYVPDENGNRAKVNKPQKPKAIFDKVVKVFYPDSDKDQREIAYDLFVYSMEKQGNTKSKDDENDK